MKRRYGRTFSRIIGILAYLLLALRLLDFNIGLLFDPKSLLLVVSGTLLLTAGCYKKGMSLSELRSCALWHSMIAGFLTCFMLLFSTLYQSPANNELLPGIALCIRPLFYTFVIQLLCKPFPAEKKGEAPASVPQIPELPSLSEEEIVFLLREQKLTDRELEIALAIWKNMPNKEIANSLFISESTVKKHSTSLYKKLQVANREQLKQYLYSLKKEENG